MPGAKSMLHRGPTPERKAAAAALLDSLGYEDAPVTVDNSEWVIAAEYARAAPDSARDARFRALYVDHMLRALRHYLPDEYVGPDGLSWIMRVPPVTSEEAAWDQEEEERVRREARAIR